MLSLNENLFVLQGRKKKQNKNMANLSWVLKPVVLHGEPVRIHVTSKNSNMLLSTKVFEKLQEKLSVLSYKWHRN